MPEIPEIVRGPARFGRRAVRGDVGAFEAGATGQLGAAVADLAETSQRLFDAHQQSKSARLQAEGRVALNDYVFELQNDPDFETHAERFESRREEINRALKGQLMPGRFQDEFETRMKLVEEAARSSVRTNALKRSLEQTIANLDQTERLAVKEWARAGTPEARAAIRSDYRNDLRAALRSGALTMPDVIARQQRFDSAGGTARVIQGLRENPARTLAELKDPESDLSESLTEEERQRAMTQAQAEIRELERIAKAEIREREARDKAARVKLERDTAVEAAIEAERGALSVDWVRDRKDDFSKSDFQYYLGIAASGGRLAEGLPDPAYYARMMRLRVDDPIAYANATLDPSRLGGQFPSMVKAQNAILENRPTAVESWGASVKRRIEELDITDEDEAGRFIAKANQMRQDFVQRYGKEPLPTEEDALLNVLSITVRDKPRGWREWWGVGAEIPWGAAGVVEDYAVEGVPTEEMASILKALEMTGEPPTPTTIRDLYRRRLQKRKQQ